MSTLGFPIWIRLFSLAALASLAIGSQAFAQSAEVDAPLVLPDEVQGGADQDLEVAPFDRLDVLRGCIYYLDGSEKYCRHRGIGGFFLDINKAPWQAQLSTNIPA